MDKGVDVGYIVLCAMDLFEAVSLLLYYIIVPNCRANVTSLSLFIPLNPCN